MYCIAFIFNLMVSFYLLENIHFRSRYDAMNSILSQLYFPIPKLLPPLAAQNGQLLLNSGEDAQMFQKGAQYEWR